MNDSVFERALPDEAATRALGSALAAAVDASGTEGVVVALSGELGAGKTTLVRAWLRALGHDGPVRSPTYALVEPYDLPSGPVHHFDLYRLADEDELDAIGFRDYLSAGLTLVEWPERAAGLLRPRLHVHLSHAGADARGVRIEGEETLVAEIASRMGCLGASG